jgi:hypothetical protein
MCYTLANRKKQHGTRYADIRPEYPWRPHGPLTDSTLAVQICQRPPQIEVALMTTMQCTHRDHIITADVVEHPGIPTPWAGGCHITTPDGRTTRRLPLPIQQAFLVELESAQRASIAHGKWLVDQCLDQGVTLFDKPAAEA